MVYRRFSGVPFFSVAVLVETPILEYTVAWHQGAWWALRAGGKNYTQDQFGKPSYK